MRTPMSNRDFNKVAKQAFFLVNSPTLLCLFVHFLPSKHRLNVLGNVFPVPWKTIASFTLSSIRLNARCKEHYRFSKLEP